MKLLRPGVFLVCAIAALAIAGCNSRQKETSENAPLNITNIKPPQGGSWTDVVTATPAGGFVMGNPNAKAKLIEYGSMTCPHCKAFDDEGVPHLLDYVKTGQVSWEFRNYVRDAFDVTASLIARCNGANGFFPLMHALFDDQQNWQSKIEQASPDQIKAMQDLPPNQQFLALAKVTGFQQWAAARGLPVENSTKCLTDENAVNQLIQIRSNVTTQFPQFPGTPTFILNGRMLEQAATWDMLRPEIDAALKS